MLIALAWLAIESEKVTPPGIARLILACTFGSLLAVGAMGTGVELTAYCGYRRLCSRFAARLWQLRALGTVILLSIYGGTAGLSGIVHTVAFSKMVGKGNLRIEAVIAIVGASFLACSWLVIRVFEMLLCRKK
jgi:uncharacterized membrane protein YciS (DUF1049 family)